MRIVSHGSLSGLRRFEPVVGSSRTYFASSMSFWGSVPSDTACEGLLLERSSASRTAEGVAGNAIGYTESVSFQ